MIAIIYYQEVTVVGVVSIALSLLSISIKSLMFSSAITFKIFIFNWLSLLTDFFGIFCSLTFVFYTYTTNKGEIITKWGKIWIFQSIIMWSIVCLSFGLCVAAHMLTNAWYDIRSRNYRRWNLFTKISIMTLKTTLWFVAFIFLSTLAFLGTSIGLLSPIAFVCFVAMLCLILDVFLFYILFMIFPIVNCLCAWMPS